MAVSSPRVRRLVLVQVVGLSIGAIAIAVRWVLQEVSSRPIPPGLVMLALMAGLVTAVRRPFVIAVGTAVAGLVLIQLLTNVTAEVLFGGRGVGVATTVWVELAGVAGAVLTGTVALVLLNRADRVDRADRVEGVDQQRPRRWWAQVAGLLVLAPICAEYLAAYDDSTGHPAQLLGNLVIFIPLYGCSALLVREVARRAGLGWLGMVLLAAAFGLLQAGIVDQSLFSTDYRHIDGWEVGYRATLIAPLGVSGFNAVNFVGGHVIFSICAPIALVEAARPRNATAVWLGAPGLGVTTVVYLAASALVLHLHLTTESSHASPAQVVVSALLILAFILGAFRWGRWPRRTDPRPAPRVWTVAALALVVSTVAGFATETWTGVALTVGPYLVATLGIAYWSRRCGWGVRHVAVVAAAPLVVRAALAFTYDPLVGDVSDLAKHGHHVVMLAVVLAAAGLALRPRAEAEAPSLDTVAR